MSAVPKLPACAVPGQAPKTKPRKPGTLLRFPFRPAPGGPPRRTAEELAFLPAALEIVETPASPTLRLTAGLICGLLTAAVVWPCFARIDEVAVASGKVVPMGQVKVVQPLEAATIRAILVDDGDRVRVGDLLVDLDPTEAEADLLTATYARGQAALDDEAARLLVDGTDASPFVVPPGVELAQAEQTHRRALAELGRHAAERAGTAADVAEKRAELGVNAGQIAREQAVLPLWQEKHDTAKGLYDRRIAPRPPVLDAEQQLHEHRAALRGAEGSVGQIEAQIRSLEAKQAQSDAAFLADALDRRAKAQDRMSQLDGDIRKARQHASNRRLVAPVSGTVQNVKVHTPGAVVTAGDVLMSVVPDGAGIEIDASVENRDIGFVRTGQEVEVKVDAFPFTRYGLLRGTLRHVARDAATPPAPGRDGVGAAGAPDAGLTYPAKVRLSQDWILADGRREPIQPGMRVEAEIKTGERRVIEYLLSPVVQAVQEAGRER